MRKNKLATLSKIVTSAILLGGLGLAGFFIVEKWHVFMPSNPEMQKPLIVGIVAFVVTFAVLILITLCISLLKSITDKPTKKSLDQAEEATPSQDDPEIIAVIAAAITAFEDDTRRKETNIEFKVREMNPCGSSWRIVTKDDFESVGG